MNRANDLDGKRWLRNSISVWRDVVKTPEETALKHLAMFPISLAVSLIETFLRSDQKVVLDPFVGSGSTVIAAELLGKTGIGLDISEQYLQMARSRPLPMVDLFNSEQKDGSGQWILHNVDARDLLTVVEPETVDMVITSPPYWNILKQRRTADGKEIRNYGDDEIDLGTIEEYHFFMDGLFKVLDNLLSVLKPGGYCLIVVMDLRKGNRFYPLHSDVAEGMQNIGFIYDDLIIWDRGREYNNLRPLGYPAVFRINKVHEYILIFQKPKT